MPDLKQWIKKCSTFFKKYKYAALILLLGIVLLTIPSGKEDKQEESEIRKDVSLTEDDYTQKLQAQMEEMLSKIDGAGQVRVMLTLRRGNLTHYQSDVQSDHSEEDAQKRSSEDKKTVILSEGSAYDTLAVSTVEYPLFQGALIVCEGAERASVKLDLIQAVSALTGLNSEQITVVKMNGWRN